MVTRKSIPRLFAEQHRSLSDEYYVNAKDKREDYEMDQVDEEEPKVPNILSSREQILERLNNNFFIIAGGAWQHLWENNESSKSIGFNSDESNEPDTPNLKNSIQPELLKRFRDNFIYLQKMTSNEYVSLIPRIASKLPEHISGAFIAKANANLSDAVVKDLGMRYFETTITSVLVENQNTKKIQT